MTVISREISIGNVTIGSNGGTQSDPRVVCEVDIVYGDTGFHKVHKIGVCVPINSTEDTIDQLKIEAVMRLKHEVDKLLHKLTGITPKVAEQETEVPNEMIGVMCNTCGNTIVPGQRSKRVYAEVPVDVAGNPYSGD